MSTAAIAASTIGTALLAGLLPTRPALLLALSPANLVLLLVAHRIPFPAFYAIRVSRLVLSDVAPYLLGYAHGRRGVERVIRRERHRRLIDDHADRLQPAALVALFLSASAVVAAIAGLARVRPVVFVALDVFGTTVRMLSFWWIAGLFATQLDAVNELIRRWQPVLLAGGVIVAVSITLVQRRSRRS